LWLYVAPPVVGGIIGYFTNDIAIKMLFRPYRAIYIGKRQLPFTPGLIPRNQERLAKRVSDTIMGSLLTPDELQKLARRLLQPERVQSGILWLLKLALEQVKLDKEQKKHQDCFWYPQRLSRAIFAPFTKGFSAARGLFRNANQSNI